ncbi:MAG TPA: selenocysteine-specific translation elongation factor [Acetobacteraceae bacterium]|nr:selenocysteine-specific translation elongation factor [Acetobacteraceae bacterium]
MIIALAGHVDHGKTALIRALTGIDADRLPEEKKRGMTIDLGFAHLRLPSGAMVGFVDVPGHERFLANMLAVVLSIDTVLLVVAADDGPMPQTREHLSILGLTGISDVTAVLSKIDRVDATQREAARQAVRNVLDDAGYATTPILEASGVTLDGIPAVLASIEAKAAAHEARDASGGFRLAIDRSFSPAGAGLVVTGTVTSGIVTIGDRLLLSPSRLAARVRGIQVHNEVAVSARAGDRCALAISGPRVERARLKRGDWLIDPSLHAPTQRIDALVRAVGDRGARHASRMHIHFGTSSVTGRVLMQKASDLAPGETGFVSIALDRPSACLYGDRLVLRDDSSGRVVAGGHVVDPFSPDRRMRREQRAASLAAHAIAAPEDSFQALLAAEGWVDQRRFMSARNLPVDFAPKASAEAIRIGSAASPVVVSAATISRVGRDLTRFLADWHAAHSDQMGPGKAELLRAAGVVPAVVAEAILDVSRARGEVVREGLAWRLPAHQPVLPALDESAWPRIKAALTAADLRPPRIRELATERATTPEEMQALLQRLERFGRLVGVAPNRFFLPETITALGEIAQELGESEEGGFTAAEFNKRSGIGRNLTIIVLEYLDSIGVTRRTGDLRHVVRSAEEAMG